MINEFISSFVFIIKVVTDILNSGCEFCFLNINDIFKFRDPYGVCLLYTSDAADERSSVDLGGRRIIKKKNTKEYTVCRISEQT